MQLGFATYLFDRSCMPVHSSQVRKVHTARFRMDSVTSQFLVVSVEWIVTRNETPPYLQQLLLTWLMIMQSGSNERLARLASMSIAVV